MSTRSLASDLRALGRRGLRAIQAAPGWLGGILAGIQAVALSYLLVLAPAMAVVASAPSASATTGVDWSGAADFSVELWLLAHGAPASIGGTAVTLLPLGLTLVCAAMMAGIARRFAARTWGSWALAAGTYAGLVGVVASLAGGVEDRPGMTRTVVIAFVVAGVGAAVGVWRAHGLELGWLARVPAVVRVGLRRAAAVQLLWLCAAATAQTVWAVAGRDQIAQTATALGVDGVGGVVLAAAELIYAPTMVVWSLAWLTGQGFSVGLGSAYAPDTLDVAALPQVPLLGALPQAAGGALVWAPLALVALAVVVRVVTSRASMGWPREAGADAVAVGVLALATAVLAIAAGGSAGPGAMAAVGPEPLPVATAAALLALVGLAIGTVLDRAARWLWSVLPWGRRAQAASPPPAEQHARVAGVDASRVSPAPTP